MRRDQGLDPSVFPDACVIPGIKNPEERQQAVVLSQSLKLSEQLYHKGETDADKIRGKMTELIEQQPLARIDYISIADGTTLTELTKVTPTALVSLAVKFGNTRLIDNTILE